MCSGYLRRSSNVRVDMTDGALRDEFKKTHVRDYFRYAGVTTGATIGLHRFVKDGEYRKEIHARNTVEYTGQ